MSKFIFAVEIRKRDDGAREIFVNNTSAGTSLSRMGCARVAATYVQDQISRVLECETP